MATRKPKADVETKPAPVVPVSIEDAKAMMEAEIKRQLATEWTNEKIEQKVKQVIHENFMTIIKVQLGFAKNSWGATWEVDHCNNRGGQTEVGTRIAKHAQAAVDKVLKEHADRFELDKTAIDAMVKDFNDQIHGYRGREAIQQLAQQKIRKFTALLGGDITGA